MKHAILILAHKNPTQLLRLVRSLDSDHFDFFILIDKKQPLKPFTDTVVAEKSTVCFLAENERLDITLNDFSLVDATCRLMRKAKYFNPDIDYKYYILLTGQDYPIKNADYIYNKLNDSFPTLFIDSYSVEEGSKRGIDWVKKLGTQRYSQRLRRILMKAVGRNFYYSKYGKLIKVIPKIWDLTTSVICRSPRETIRQFSDYEYSAGSHFWMLPNIAVSHILKQYDEDERINHIFKHVPAAEESYFQTILSTLDADCPIPEPWGQYDSPEKEMDNPALRLIKWYEGGVKTNGHPAIWRLEDFEFITNSNALFARKFDLSVDSEIINLIDKHINQKANSVM